MKKFVILVSALLLSLTGCGDQQKSTHNRAEEIRLALENRDQSRVLVVSHRGDWRGFPENSLEAIESAIAMGVDIVELDVQMTSDSVLILMHDSKLDRTTTGRGPVSAWTLDSIKTLKLRNGCAIHTKHTVPTLEEALLTAKGRIMINLDKADRYFDMVYALTEKTGTTNLIIMKGGASPEKVQERYGKYLDNIIYMPVLSLDKEDAEQTVVRFIDQLNPVAFELLYKNDGNPLPKRVPEVIGGRALIWYNTLWDTMAGGHDDDASLENPDNGYGYLIDQLGCRIIQTDRPQMLIDYLRSRGLHD